MNLDDYITIVFSAFALTGLMGLLGSVLLDLPPFKRKPS